MIKINELRIGNYLSLCGINYSVNEIKNSLQSIELKRKNTVNPKLNEYEECDLDCEQLEPIEITEKHITDFGFVSRNTDRKFDLNDFSVKINKKGSAFFYFDNFCVAGFGNVHQLQNLYFVLTCSELVFSTEP